MTKLLLNLAKIGIFTFGICFLMDGMKAHAGGAGDWYAEIQGIGCQDAKNTCIATAVLLPVFIILGGLTAAAAAACWVANVFALGTLSGVCWGLTAFATALFAAAAVCAVVLSGTSNYCAMSCPQATTTQNAPTPSQPNCTDQAYYSAHVYECDTCNTATDPKCSAGKVPSGITPTFFTSGTAKSARLLLFAQQEVADAQKYISSADPAMFSEATAGGTKDSKSSGVTSSGGGGAGDGSGAGGGGSGGGTMSFGNPGPSGGGGTYQDTSTGTDEAPPGPTGFQNIGDENSEYGSDGGGGSGAATAGGSRYGSGRGGSGVNGKAFDNQLDMGAEAGGGTGGSGGNAMLSEDPEDYFTRIGIEESLFAKVHKRYESKARTWAMDSIKNSKKGAGPNTTSDAKKAEPSKVPAIKAPSTEAPKKPPN